MPATMTDDHKAFLRNARRHFTRGRRFRVIREGARLMGMQPIPGGQQGWGRKLEVGEILTCDGESMGWGSDSVPIIKWRGPSGEYVANDCEFRPAIGGMWVSCPHPDFLEPVDDAA